MQSTGEKRTYGTLKAPAQSAFTSQPGGLNKQTMGNGVILQNYTIIDPINNLTINYERNVTWLAFNRGKAARVARLRSTAVAGGVHRGSTPADIRNTYLMHTF